MMQPETKLSLMYKGSAVRDGRLNVYDVAADMIAFTEFVTEAGHTAFGSEVEVKAEMSGFRPGSVITDLMFQIAGPAISLFSANTVKDWLSLIKEAFTLWKHLKGAPPASAAQVSGDHWTVTNRDGTVIQVQTATINLVMNEKATEAVARFVGEQLRKPGVESLQILADDRPIAKVSEAEADYFKDVRPSTPLATSEFEYALNIENAAFKDGNKWRFSDGGSSFAATIEDEEFLEAIDAGEPFAKGDALRVRMRVDQSRQGVALSTSRTIVKVLEHIRRGRQDNLF